MSGARMTIAEFLLARIAEDEANVTEDGHAIDCEDAYGMHLEPGRARAECGAKRQIVALHGDNDADAACQSHAGNWSYEPCPTLRALASVYANHPDYREEWRP